jgi:hypothetical protein
MTFRFAPRHSGGERKKREAICYDLDEQMDNQPMKAIELLGDIDEQHRLRAEVPKDLPPGQVRLIVLLPEEDDAGTAWASGIAKAWSAELSDAREDIYTLDDGKPIDAAG